MIEHTFCINLKRRVDRWKVMESKFRRLNLSAERVEAVDGKEIFYKDAEPLTRYELGCLLSHRKCFELAKERGYKNFLLLEDDVFFVPNFNKKLEEALKDIPDDWDMIYLGSLLEQNWSPLYDMSFSFTPIKNNIWKAYQCTGGHAIIFKDTMYDCIQTEKRAVDIIYALTHGDKNAYVVIPNLIGQRPDYSDIKNLWDITRIQTKTTIEKDI